MQPQSRAQNEDSAPRGLFLPYATQLTFDQFSALSLNTPPIYRTARSILKELWDLPMKIFFIASNDGGDGTTRDEKIGVFLFLSF